MNDAPVPHAPVPHAAAQDTPPVTPATARDLFEATTSRPTAVPWHAQVPGQAMERVFPPSDGWVRLSANPTTLLHSITGDARAAERLLSLSFYAFARPGQAVGVILDPFAPDVPPRASRQHPRLVNWRSLHPDQRRPLLAHAFDTALVASTPTGLLSAVRDRAAHDPDPEVRTIWGTRTSTLLRDLLDHAALDESERASLRTMVALGAFT